LVNTNLIHGFGTAWSWSRGIITYEPTEVLHIDAS
jgi:hypothetical protein